MSKKVTANTKIRVLINGFQFYTRYKDITDNRIRKIVDDDLGLKIGPKDYVRGIVTRIDDSIVQVEFA